MEAELTGSLRNTSNNDNQAMTEEVNVDEDFTTKAKASNDMEIDLKEEQKTQAYKKTMNMDIENINKFEKRKQIVYNSMEDNIQSYRT